MEDRFLTAEDSDLQLNRNDIIQSVLCIDGVQTTKE